MAEQFLADGEALLDAIVGFTLPQRNARGRCVRIGPVLDKILDAHDYPGSVRLLLAEALVLAALLGSLTKQAGSQITLQARSPEGVVALLVCDYRDGALRGYVQFDRGRLETLGANLELDALFGADAFLAITFDLAEKGQRYQGIVPLTGTSLADACEAYFRRSEQLPTLIRAAVRNEGRHCVAGGLLVQHLPDGEEGRDRLHTRTDHPDWEHVAVMAESVRHAELIDGQLGIESLLWRLFHEEEQIRVESLADLCRGCRCSESHYRSILARFPASDLAEMREDDGLVHVNCEFCSRIFTLDM